MEPTILPVKPNTITADDKVELKAAGIIVIECDDPESIRLIRPCTELSGGDLLLAALGALNSECVTADGQKQRFTKLVFDKIKKDAA